MLIVQISGSFLLCFSRFFFLYPYLSTSNPFGPVSVYTLFSEIPQFTYSFAFTRNYFLSL